MQEQTITIETPATLQVSQTVKDQIARWVLAKAESMGVKVFLYIEAAKPQGRWLRIPLYVEADDLINEISANQDIEDAWNNQEPEPIWKLILVPATK